MQLFDQNILTAWKHKLKINLGLETEETEGLTVSECEKLLSDVDKEDIPFMQLFNMWYASDDVRSLALSTELGQVAAQLLGTKSVRLYQDALFVKRSGDGPTRWHSDLNMAPFDTNDFVTCWIPLQRVPSQSNGGSGLSFATGSHRDFALPFWSEPTEVDLAERYQVVTNYEGFEVGDCTFHHGWCLHSAPGNTLPDTRYAYSISFVADGVNLLQEEGHIRYPDNEDFQSYRLWIDDIGWGGLADHPLIPIVYQDDNIEEDRMTGDLFRDKA
jgi:ectoine hydroxylase-related dioxygenase (phytanoyl-CoA dioxygenase family)